jgi:iron(II)-dependent oxidoreductase
MLASVAGCDATIGATQWRGPTVQGVDVAIVDTAQIRGAGRELLSLALMDARNQTLRWAAAFEASPAGLTPLLRELGHAGWFQEYWIARNVQRQRGEHGDPSHPKLASILPDADLRFADPRPRAADGATSLPDPQSVRQYLVDTLETTLDLLAQTPDTDDALYFYRLALLREDAAVERWAERAQTLGVDSGLVASPSGTAARAPLLFPATRLRIGSEPGGFVFDAEKWAHEVALPEFEIDAQAVTWAQYCEFVEDGGYDDRRHWSAAGWDWVRAQGRRTPRHVDQMRHGVLLRRYGKLVRVPLVQAVVHVSWYEADAWCRWAGRRLPAEAEWEAAVLHGASRGFRWGEVREWTAGTLRPYPGCPGPSPGQDDGVRGTAVRVLRGAALATAPRLRHPRARSGLSAERDEGFCGFRSCAV